MGGSFEGSFSFGDIDPTETQWTGPSFTDPTTGGLFSEPTSFSGFSFEDPSASWNYGEQAEAMATHVGKHNDYVTALHKNIKEYAKKGAAWGAAVMPAAPFVAPVTIALGAIFGAVYGAIKTGSAPADVSAAAVTAATNKGLTQQEAQNISSDAINAVQESMASPESEQKLNTFVSASQNPMFAQILNSTKGPAGNLKPNVDMAVDTINAMVQAKEQGLTGSKAISAAKQTLYSKYGSPKGEVGFALEGAINATKQLWNTPGAWDSLQRVDASSVLSAGGAATQNTSTTGGTNVADTTNVQNILSEFEKINADIKFIHDISELEGGLSDEEKAFLETIRSNATTNLTNAVNESTLDLAETEIARMVDKGVLQGNIGSETMSKIYEKSGKIVGEQSRNIESDVAKMGLQISEQKKLNTLDLWGKEQTWNQNLLNALTSMRGQDTSFKIAQLGGANNLALANKEMDAWKEAQDKQMWGNIGSILIDKWL